MRKTAIILGLLLIAQAAFAGGTVLYMDGAGDGSYYQQTGPIDPNATYYTKDGVYGAIDEAAQGTKKTVYTKRKFRLGRNHNDPYEYWNFGRVNFGSGFTSTGASVKQY